MAAYAWMITKDHLADTKRDEKGTFGPSDVTDAQKDALLVGDGSEFKMYDDDGELYYTGRAVWAPLVHGNEEVVFGPLDDYGMPNAGCTEIEWKDYPDWG